MKKKEKLVKDISLPLHFKEMVERVKIKQKLSLHELTEFYIVNLLTRFILTTNLYSDADKEGKEEVLALKLYNAIQKRSIEDKIAILKNIGDLALYISGFFSECLAEKLTDIDYYITMGEGAYGAASELSKGKKNKETVVDIFKELSQKFKKIVDLLTEISELSSITTNRDLLRIYEKWLKTKSPRLKKKLIEKGILPVFSKTTDNTN